MSNWTDCSHACGVKWIEPGEWTTFIVTGGRATYPSALNTVVRYSRTGEAQDLPALSVRRSGHACATFLNGRGHYVLLVTGGGNVVGDLDSTELLDGLSSSSWRHVAKLPSARGDLRAATLDNKLFIFGKLQSLNFLIN